MHCLVTGAAGFIGSHLAARLIAEGHNILGVDALTDYYAPALKERNLGAITAAAASNAAATEGRFTFVEANLAGAALDALVADAELVFHAAAQPGVRASWGDAFAHYLRNNVLATQRLLEALRRRHSPPPRVVYTSSSSVYGDTTLPMQEDHPSAPLAPYGVTKRAAEQLCALYGQNYGIPTTILRYFSVYGPRQRPDMLIAKFLAAARRHEPLTIYGDGEQSRDFTYIDDIVDATVAAAITPSAAGETINIGTGERTTINRLVDIITRVTTEAEASGADPPLTIEYVGEKCGEVRHTKACIAKARRLLDYAPHVTLEEGVGRQLEAQIEMKNAD